jgi:alpha-galactosidase
LVNLSEERFALVREGIAVHKEIRQDIARGLPFWPLGLPRIGDAWAAFGLDCGERGYLAVWRNDAPEPDIEIPLSAFPAKRTLEPECIYPKHLPAEIELTEKADRLRITLPAPISARLFRLW